MSTVSSIKTKEPLDRQIDASVARNLADGPRLPGEDDDIVRLYIRKIEGKYDVGRAKLDTDNAVELLDIAYNATPDKVPTVRNKISDLMDKLISAQVESALAMESTIGDTTSIMEDLTKGFSLWSKARTGGTEKTKTYVDGRFLRLTDRIQEQALRIRDRLLEIAKAYDGIIEGTAVATAASTEALGKRLDDKAAIDREIVEAKARGEALESLLKDLQAQVEKFDRMAREYERQASSAEHKAFVMSIVRVGAEMISSAVPAIAMAAGGPAPMLASGVLGALSGPPAAREPAPKAAEAAPRSSPGAGDRTADDIENRNKLSKSNEKMRLIGEKTAELKKDIARLEADRKPAAAGKDAAPGGPGAAGDADLERQISVKKAELKQQEEARLQTEQGIASLQASIGALDKSMGKLSEEQKQQATSLRDLQMQMLNKVEQYEQEKRNQSSELIRINSLLKGKKNEEETIQIAIKSLNIGIGAMKKAKEILVEIAAFFKSFANTLGMVAKAATAQKAEAEEAVGDPDFMDEAIALLIGSIDAFYVKQVAEWSAVKIVSEKFHASFNDGFSKANKLSGEYLTGDRLATYLDGAGDRLAAIAAQREEAYKARVVLLNSERAKLAASAKQSA